MTDSEPKLPDPTGSGGPTPDPAAPTPPFGTPMPPDAAPPTLPTDPPLDPTTQMPVTEPGVGAGMPPVPPADIPGVAQLPGDETPWYKKPGPIAIMVIVALAVVGLLAWLIFGGGDDDDEATATSSLLILETTDETGSVIDVGFIVSVVGPADAPTSFEWLRPDTVAPGTPAGASTGTDGRVDFEWEADATVADPQAWLSTVSAVVNVPAGWVPFGPVLDCVHQPLEGQQSVVAMNIEIESIDTSVDRVGALTFPNFTFSPGDTVTCALAAIAPPPTTSSTTPDTTTPETTTPETTTPETTTPESTVPETTVPETTVPATTIPVVTVPPQVGATLWDVIDNSPGLTELKALIELSGLESALQDPAATLTLFAPSNQAIEDARNVVPAPDFTDPDVVTAVLLAHVDNTGVLLAADVFALTEVPVAGGGPQPVDADAATIGGASVIQADVQASNGVIHVIDRVMPIQP
jgi:uncharacterized surface protein with fasciclin (FAS1) repeats